MSGLIVPQCAKCVDGWCSAGGWVEGELPGFCPMGGKAGVIDAAMAEYGEDGGLYLNSTITEQRAYEVVRGRVVSVRPRVLEIIKLSEMMGWGRIGVAFCSGLKDEARRIVEIFEDADLEVYSVRCKCGGIDKTEFGIPRENKIVALTGEPDRFEAGCNPVVQAAVLNSEDANAIPPA